MKTSSTSAWWREMGAISRGMMFIEGNIATPAALDGAEPANRARVSAPRGRGRRDPVRTRLRISLHHLYRDLLFLGGRPMTAGHNDDVGEPFPQAGFDAARSPRRPRGSGRPQRTAAPLARPCASC